jgi:hypothetical protein
MTKDDETKDDDTKGMSVEELFADFFNTAKETNAKQVKKSSIQFSTISQERRILCSSQKASDMIKYQIHYNSGEVRWKPPKTELILLTDTYEVVQSAFDRLLPECEDGKTAFLRTCPQEARHGVLESLSVTQETLKDSWKKLVETMEKHDPKGSLILQPFINATSSCVLAPQQFAAVAEGHDGITAGINEETGRMLYFALNPQQTYLSNDIHMVNPNCKFDTSTKTTNYELEFVYQRDEDFKRKMGGGSEPFITQIRGSPPNPPRELPFTYIDENGVERAANIDGSAGPTGRCEAKEVWTASGLEEVAWLEANITRDLCPDGFVISHPTGSLMSHICAHARQHSIPYVVGEVNVGDRFTEGSQTWLALDPNWDIEPQPYNPCVPEYIEAFKAGLLRSQTHWQRQQGWFAHFFHQWVGLNYNGIETAYLAGGFVGWMVKAILALSLGEMRYSQGNKKNTCVDLWPTLTAIMGETEWEELSGEKHAGTTRQHYYALLEQLNLDTVEMEMALRWCKKHFSTGWGTHTSFGGANWGACASRGADVCKSVNAFLAEPNQETLNDLIGEVNLAKNLEHNGGFLYNKFLSRKAFDYSSLHTDKAGNQTGLFSHSPDSLAYMFRTYELAREFLDGDANKGNKAPTNDWVEIFGFLNGKGASYFRQHFIASDLDVPESIRNAAIACGPKLLHYNNKYSTEESYVPCGISTCELCIKNDVLVVNLKYGNVGSQLLSTSYPEVFMAGGKEVSSVDSYAVASLLREKKYTEVTPKMWIDGWNGLNKLDAAYALLSDLMSKFLSNQMADNNQWTEEVLKLLKEEK